MLLLKHARLAACVAQVQQMPHNGRPGQLYAPGCELVVAVLQHAQQYTLAA
jgi:hypothetical protein